MKRLCSVVILVHALAYPSIGHCVAGLADIVFDPSNYASNLVQQYQAIQHTINDGIQIANQVKQIEAQLQGLVYQAQNLQSNPLKLLDQIKGLWQQYNGILNTADGLTYTLSQSAGQFDQAFPQLAGTGLGATMQDISARSTALLQQMRAATKTAMKTQSVYEQLCEFQRLNDLALASAQSAVGTLQVEQAQAQQTAVTNEQLSSLVEVTAANGRVQAQWIMKQVQEEEAAKESMKRWADGFGGPDIPGVKQGKGITLP